MKMKIYLSVISTTEGNKLTLSKSKSCISEKCWLKKSGEYKTKKCYSISGFDDDSVLDKYAGSNLPTSVKPPVNAFISTVMISAVNQLTSSGELDDVYFDNIQSNDKYCHILFKCGNCDDFFDVLLRHIVKLYSDIYRKHPEIRAISDNNTLVMVCDIHSSGDTAQNTNPTPMDVGSACDNSGKSADENPHVLIEKLRMAILRVENELNEKINLITDYKKDAEKFREMRSMFSSP